MELSAFTRWDNGIDFKSSTQLVTGSYSAFNFCKLTTASIAELNVSLINKKIYIPTYIQPLIRKMDHGVIFLNNVVIKLDLFLHCFMFVSVCSQRPETDLNVSKQRNFKAERSFMSLQVMKYSMLYYCLF